LHKPMPRVRSSGPAVRRSAIILRSLAVFPEECETI
jgi:hypothetical protein